MPFNDQGRIKIPYTQGESAELINNLRARQRLSLSEHNRLIQVIKEPHLFSEQLLDIYIKRARKYLKHSCNHLVYSMQLSTYQAQDLAIGYVYSTIAQQDYYTSVFALMSLIRGNIYATLQPDLEINNVTLLMNNTRCKLGVILGFYSIMPFLNACKLLPNDDPVLEHLFEMNSAVFKLLVPIWQLYKDVGYLSLARLNVTSKNTLFSSVLMQGFAAHNDIMVNIRVKQKNLSPEDTFASVFSNTYNFNLLRYCLSTFSTYIQQTILQPYYQSYLEKADKANSLHQEIIRLFSLAIDRNKYEMSLVDDRISLMQLIYFTSDFTSEMLIKRYEEIQQNLFKILNNDQMTCGSSCNLALRQLIRYERTQEYQSKVNDITQMVSDLIAEERNQLDQIRQQNEERCNEVANVITRDREGINESENNVTLHYQSEQTALDNWRTEKNNQISERARRITDFEAGAISQLQVDSSNIDRFASECRDRIRERSGARFFTGVTTNQVVPFHADFNRSLFTQRNTPRRYI